MKKTVLNKHVIYGSWDDVINNQFMVYYHENGTSCSVFIFDGCDYGGGIDFYVENVCSKTLDSIIDASDELGEYDTKQNVVKFIKVSFSARSSAG